MSEYPYNNENGQTDLMAAAYNGDLEELLAILSMPCDVDAQDSHGLTALMYAATKGHAEIVQQIITAGADLELQSKQRYTALMYAVRAESLATVKTLLNAKADPDVHEEGSTIDTPLTLAAGRGCLPTVRCLVAAGADVSLRGGILQLPAEAVARIDGHHDVSEFLLYHEKRYTP